MGQNTTQVAKTGNVLEQGVVPNVLCELKAMREVGMNVPTKAEAYVRENEQSLQDYYDGGMPYSEIADHVCLVA
ncbi:MULTISPECIES: hypothetical protein [Burkholderia cepacia complex]|uniref:hypothetical protein n=1 Tax=Burkholderia cepacia complex TaxID=87882 RepID=UPI00061870C1|nr:MULTISPECIES: hypothetical protein [Burkholderia cepacia complex]MBR8092903.1 hypothetical protein [Burkholderia cenocepacia]MBY4714763.1 hypothetical protein [Burkholderia cepacia]MBY4740703.1 hypothetical protein [Burkholderia cepacia]MBY4748171.1 hypothetical protein [Burkholderia cepacia]MBY4761912.1 hypothetical protein [Burkholderia cepacia]